LIRKKRKRRKIGNKSQIFKFEKLFKKYDFYFDGALNDQSKYVNNLLIPHFQESGTITGRAHMTKVIASADTESLDEGNGL
jgi:hypothetical protein